MGIPVYSPALTLLFVWGLLWIMMDIRLRELPTVKKWLVPLLILLLAAFNQFLKHQIGTPGYGRLIFWTMHLPFFLIFRYATRCSLIKMGFMILTALVFTVPSVLMGSLTSLFFPDVSWALLVSDLTSYALILLLVYTVFRRSFHDLLRYGDDRLFLQYSLVPLLYYIYVFAWLYTGFSPWSSVSEMLVRFLPSIEVFVFYFLLLHSYKILSEKREMETIQAALTQELDVAEEQIALLNAAHTQTAVYQHNMRHHLNVIDGFLAAGKPEQAQDYIQKVRSDVEAISPRKFCENELVDLLCSSFSKKADAIGARLTVEARLPQALPLSDTELCSLLSNGLENALHAVSVLEDPRQWVELYCGVRLNKMLIEIRNPYSGEIAMRDGLPIPSQKGHGYGCHSIRSITEHHRGLCSFEPRNGVFTLRVMLPMEDS